MIYGQPVTFGGASGEIDITADGTYDVSKYATANVDVVSLGTRSITANGTYDVTKYATANVNVQSAPVLLWTNARPTSAFANQTVNVGSGYDGFIIKAKYGTNTTTENYMTYVYFPVSNVVKYLSCNGGQSSALYRAVTANASGAIVFASGNTNTSYVIPLYIWGVKFTL